MAGRHAIPEFHVCDLDAKTARGRVGTSVHAEGIDHLKVVVRAVAEAAIAETEDRHAIDLEFIDPIALARRVEAHVLLDVYPSAGEIGLWRHPVQEFGGAFGFTELGD